MCVICVKPSGVAMPSVSKMQDMFSSNRDGAGFMFVRDRKVVIRKGFMKFKHLRKAIMRENLTNDDIVVFHFRIATAGSTSPGNTHPFPISDKVNELKSINIETDIAMAHNGILSYKADAMVDLSDTMTFIRDILSEQSVRENLFEPSIFSLIEMSIGTNKIVFLDKDGVYTLLGDWQEDSDKDGCYYSNLFFKRTITPSYSYRPRGYWDSINKIWVDLDDDEEVGVSAFTSSLYSKKNKQIEHTTKERIAQFAENQAAQLVHVDYDDANCPVKECGYPIASIHQLACTKCGVIFYRDHDNLYPN